jgi:cellulose synthase/poly-beta-1,6-N-acetylglucosamine synthase-like glycosyltransferase
VEFLFWLFAISVGWCYVGYPVLVATKARWRPRPIKRDKVYARPLSVSVLLAVRNEAAVLGRRVANLLNQSYPNDLLRVVIICNGSTDGSDEIAENIARQSDRVEVVHSAGEQGKSGALNRGIAHADDADVFVFADARQLFAPDAINELLASFADTDVGAVSGRLIVKRANDTAVEGVRLYWGFESWLRLCESRCGSVVGATGAIYAVRRDLVTTLPSSLILDDVYQPMRVAMKGKRVVLAENALAFDEAAHDQRSEYRRKRRTMVGNLQLLSVLPDLLSPRKNPLFLRYVSHKLLRLLTPFCCLGLLALGFAIGGLFYGTASILLLTAYVFGALGLLLRLPLLSLPAAFVLMQLVILDAATRWNQNASQVWLPHLPMQPGAHVGKT